MVHNKWGDGLLLIMRTLSGLIQGSYQHREGIAEGTEPLVSHATAVIKRRI